MRLQNILEKQLKKEPNYVTDNGELKKWVVINKAQNYDAELIGVLLDDKELKAKFFLEIKGVLVFNQSLFVQFLEQKNYLNDSYTAYKNKVGLNIDGKYLKQRNEVALVWPFKDCVLEGGQSREEDKREEIFFNEVLAQDEITQLLEPKVLTNAKVNNKDGEHLFEFFNRDEKLNKERSLPKNTITDNILIKGNNLLALHTLKSEFAGKIKMIYIDPPYNTGSDSFHYNDSFNHSTWLTFMSNRLKVARELLTSDGVICVHCDENEQAYLKVLMDEVIGEINFINSIVIKTKTAGVSGTHAGKSFQKSHETIHVYANNISDFEFVDQQYLLLPFEEYLKEMKDDDKSFKYTSVLMETSPGIPFKTIKDGYGKDIEIFKVEKFSTKSISRLAKEEAISEIEAYIKYYKKVFTTENAQTSIRTRVQEATDEEENMYYIEYFPKSGKNKGEKTRVYFVGPNKRLVSWFSNVAEITDGKLYKREKLGTLWDKLNWNNVTREGGVKFPNGQKPEQLLKLLIGTFTDLNEIVLDFHLGSGTTNAVALKMGRKFIGIEQLNFVENDSLQRLKNVVLGDSTGISNDVNWKGGGEFVYLELKKYNQNFIEQIESAKDTKAVLKIWKEMKLKSFLNYNVDIQKQEAHIEEFKALNLAEQKKHLLELLDKNQLYVNLSSLNDKDFAVSAEEKKVTEDFYQIKK